MGSGRAGSHSRGSYLLDAIDDPDMTDGLHPEAATFLEKLDALGSPAINALSVAGARELHERFRETDAGEDVAHVRDLAIDGPGGELPLRVYRPAGEAPFPTLVWFHGGGFVLGNLETADPTCRALANATGCVVVSVEYRKAPEHPFPAAVEDSYAATRWVVDNVSTLKGAPERVAVGGDSAGGNLAAVVSLLARDRDGPDLGYQLLVYPTVSAASDWPSHEENAEGYFLTLETMLWFRAHYFDSDIHHANPYANPLLATDLSGLPPATVVTAGFDPLRDEGIAYAETLEAAGVAVEHHHYADMIHGFFSMHVPPAELSRAEEAVEVVSDDLATALD